MLAARNLGKRFGGNWLFRGLDFEIEKGTCLAILGPNGSGKSTFLKVVAGLAAPSEGAVHLPEGDVRQTLGMAAIEMALYPSLTVREHLQTFAAIRGVAADEEAWLRRIGLEHAADRRASRLSTGMRARLRLALACQSKPQVLLLDEPTTGLDAPGKQLVASLIEEQLGRGCVLLATNDPQDRSLATHELAIAA